METLLGRDEMEEEKLVYLESLTSAKGGCSTEIKRRLVMAYSAVEKLISVVGGSLTVVLENYSIHSVSYSSDDNNENSIMMW